MACLLSEAPAIEPLVNMCINNGVAVVVVVYFLFRDWKFHDNLQVTLTTLIETVDTLKELVNSRNN
jgi:hypothetical protein